MTGRTTTATIALTSLGLMLLGLALPGSTAEAGQPWNCQCDGKPRRFIASTYKCERDLYKGKGVKVAEGFKLLVKRCTSSQFQAWQANACRRAGCKPPMSYRPTAR